MNKSKLSIGQSLMVDAPIVIPVMVGAKQQQSSRVKRKIMLDEFMKERYETNLK